MLALVSFNVMGICGLVVHFSTWTLGYEVGYMDSVGLWG